MDSESRQELDRITALEIQAMKDHEVAFLKARRDYLTDEQKEAFASLLEAPKPEKAKKKTSVEE